MKLPSLVKPVARKSRDALRNAYYAMYRQFRRPLPGEYQTYSYTRPDRYPWLFEFAARQLAAAVTCQSKADVSPASIDRSTSRLQLCAAPVGRHIARGA